VHSSLSLQGSTSLAHHWNWSLVVCQVLIVPWTWTSVGSNAVSVSTPILELTAGQYC